MNQTAAVKEAIDAYLAERPQSDGRTSLLYAALNDANTAMDYQALWLGAAGYLIAIEQLGKTVARKGSQAERRPPVNPAAPRIGGRRREVSERSFKAALIDFASAIDENDHAPLYALRCSLVHSFGLVNYNRDRKAKDKHRVFGLRETGDLVTPPKEPWDSSRAGARSGRMTTYINVRKLRDEVIEAVREVSALHLKDELRLVRGMTADRLAGERLMRIHASTKTFSGISDGREGASVSGSMLP